MNLNLWFDMVWRNENNCFVKNDNGYDLCLEDLKILKDLYLKMFDDFIFY